MNDFIRGYLASEISDKDKITVKKIYIKINNDNLYDGVLFSQIMYWHGKNKETGKPRMKVEKDGYLWIAKSYKEWADETCIKEATIRKSLDRMRNNNLIFAELYKFNSRPVLHIRINWDEFEKKLKKETFGFDLRGQVDLIPEVKSITDTTSDTTKDNINKINIGESGDSHDNFQKQKPLIEIPKKKKVSKPLNKYYAVFIELQKIEPSLTKGYSLKEIKSLIDDKGYTHSQIVKCGKEIMKREWWIQNNIKLTLNQIKNNIEDFVKQQNIDEYGNMIEYLDDGTQVITLKSEIKQDSNIIVVEY